MERYIKGDDKQLISHKYFAFFFLSIFAKSIRLKVLGSAKNVSCFSQFKEKLFTFLVQDE